VNGCGEPRTDVGGIAYPLVGDIVTYKSIPYSEPTKPVGTVAELFAGVGGFRIGLARAGWETVFSNQWEPSTKTQHASDVYVARFGAKGHSNEDIATVSEIPADFDMLVGGFPCQDYSVAKSAKSATGLEGKKGVLWWEILRLISQHKPKFIFLENVDRLLKSPTGQRGRDFAVMLSTLGNLGYTIEWRIVNAADYGFPQRRIRVFIVARRLGSENPEAKVAQILHESGLLAKALPVNNNFAGVSEIDLSKDPTAISNEFNKGGSKSPFFNTGFFSNGVAYTATTEPVPQAHSAVLGDVLIPERDVPDEYWVSESSLNQWEFLKGAKSIERTHPATGFQYKYSEGKMAFPDSLDRPSRTILTGEGGQTPSRFKHVIRTPGGYRRLTPLELERLCGFPDHWTEPPGLPYKISDGRRAFFMGNALVVGLVEKVGRELAKEIKSV
jgi:DNA (cytosine-5)-methyltransferase 1